MKEELLALGFVVDENLAFKRLPLFSVMVPLDELSRVDLTILRVHHANGTVSSVSVLLPNCNTIEKIKNLLDLL